MHVLVTSEFSEARLHLDLISLSLSLSLSHTHTHTHTLQITYDKGEEYAQKVNALFCETSALNATNVEELFIKISELLPDIVRLPTGENGCY